MALSEIRPFLLGDFHDGVGSTWIPDKYSGAAATVVADVDESLVTKALHHLADSQRRIGFPIAARAEVLHAAHGLLAHRADEFVDSIVTDTGFTVSDATREVSRAADTLLLCAEEAKRLTGETVPVDAVRGNEGRLGFTTMHPLGVVCAVTPFNSPLNTVVHKVGPALAAGNAVCLKPATQTPRSADALLRLLLDAGLPPELIAVLYGPGATLGRWLSESPVPSFYAFTGSTEVGRLLHTAAGPRRMQLEMGSISSTIICESAQLDRSIGLVANAAFRKAGQVCTSVQRLYVHAKVRDRVTMGLESLLAGRQWGDPRDPVTFVGPVISGAEADRVSSWVGQATSAGAELVCGGGRDRNVLEPVVLVDAPVDAEVMRKEIFGPVVVVRTFDDLAGAIDEINDTPYGLAAGIFTSDLREAMSAAQRLRMGSVHINETSSSRVDMMPYTGVKDSGLGREGPRYAIREMSEERLITLCPPD